MASLIIWDNGRPSFHDWSSWLISLLLWDTRPNPDRRRAEQYWRTRRSSSDLADVQAGLNHTFSGQGPCNGESKAHFETLWLTQKSVWAAFLFILATGGAGGRPAEIRPGVSSLGLDGSRAKTNCFGNGDSYYLASWPACLSLPPWVLIMLCTRGCLWFSSWKSVPARISSGASMGCHCLVTGIWWMPCGSVGFHRGLHSWALEEGSNGNAADRQNNSNNA